MHPENSLVPISREGHDVLNLFKADPGKAAEMMAALPVEEQASLVSFQAARDPRSAQDLLFLLDDEKSRKIVDDLGDRALFRIMKSQSSTHIGVLSLVSTERVQAILDLDQELFSAQGITDTKAAYHWIVSFLEEEDATFSKLLKRLDIRVVASAFQDRILRPGTKSDEDGGDEEEASFPADFLTKLDRGELKPDDLEVADEETRDILTRIFLIDERYFTDLVSLMMREEDLKSRTAEAAFERIHEQIGDMTEFTEAAEEMFVPLEE